MNRQFIRRTPIVYRRTSPAECVHATLQRLVTKYPPPAPSTKALSPNLTCMAPSQKPLPCFMQLSTLRVAIAGAGSTGLGLATLLRKRGHDVSIYGKSSHPSPTSFMPVPPLSLFIFQRNLPWRSRWAVACCCNPLVRVPPDACTYSAY